MATSVNPFHTLYLTEGVGAVDIPSFFSPVLVPHVEPLFRPGNVVLRGMQGTGKSMLLTLLDTSVRLQFWKQAQAAQSGEIPKCDPLPADQRRFVGAGINLSKSNAFKLRGIKLSNAPAENTRLACQCFADFVNCWVLRDLFESLATLISDATQLGARDRLDECGVSADLKRLNRAVKLLAEDDACSFLASRDTTEDLRRTLTSRVTAYKRLITNPRNKLPAEIEATRSLLGEPLSAAVSALRSAGVIQDDTNFIVTLDQFETMDRKAPYPDDDERVRGFVRVVDELIGGRERAVSYRIGTRPNTQLSISDASRDYVIVDLDRILQRRESGPRGRNDLFYRFAEDAFRRRIACSQIPHADEIATASMPLRYTFGRSPKVAERGVLGAPKRRERALKLEKSWPADVVQFLTTLAQDDVISARLGEAWVRQQFAHNEKHPNEIRKVEPSEWESAGEPPWESKPKAWWKKERLPLAALQVAAKNAQRLLYFGDADIVLLSGESILAFVSICREIWECDARYRAMDTEWDDGSEFHAFLKNRQAEGIRDASRSWRDNISSSPDGNTLQQLLDELGKRLHAQLIRDRKMSYPGANGISLARSDYENDLEVKRLLDAATAECFLLQRDHTPKTPSRGKSIKWYPHPILAPYYELTVQHTKEPLYLTVKKLRSWLEPHVILPRDPKTKEPAREQGTAKEPAKPRADSRQKTLPFDEGE